MAEKKYPDLVVWNEEDGFYASKLPYASNIGAPVIKPDDLVTWKSEKVLKANHYFEARYKELREQYSKLLEEAYWSDLIYKSTYSFQPNVGEKYFLYQRASGETFLSIIKPHEWKQVYVGTFVLDSDNKWIKLDDKK
jgi:hypothetical protein